MWEKIFAFFFIITTMLFAGWRQPVVSEKHLHNMSTSGGVSDISTLCRIRMTDIMAVFQLHRLEFSLSAVLYLTSWWQLDPTNTACLTAKVVP